MRDVYSAYPLRAHAYLMPYLADESGKTWLLTGIDVAHNERGRGVARGLLDQVLADADEQGVTLLLSIEPDGTGLEYDQLHQWYSRLGFVEIEDSLMSREPGRGSSAQR